MMYQEGMKEAHLVMIDCTTIPNGEEESARKRMLDM